MTTFTQDHHEQVAAFLEKRPPHYTNELGTVKQVASWTLSCPHRRDERADSRLRWPEGGIVLVTGGAPTAAWPTIRGCRRKVRDGWARSADSDYRLKH
jgi:hypothetical protein